MDIYLLNTPGGLAADEARALCSDAADALAAGARAAGYSVTNHAPGVPVAAAVPVGVPVSVACWHLTAGNRWVYCGGFALKKTNYVTNEHEQTNNS